MRQTINYLTDLLDSHRTLLAMSASRSKRTLNSLALQLYEDGIMSAIISMSFPCTENLVRT